MHCQVMRYDLVPRFSTAAVEAMQQELLEIDYKGLLHEDLMEHEVSSKQDTCHITRVAMSTHTPPVVQPSAWHTAWLHLSSVSCQANSAPATARCAATICCAAAGVPCDP